MNEKVLSDIESRWDGVSNAHTRLTFEEARADMQALLSVVREACELRRRISELEAHVLKRNNDMKAFASEVAKLAYQKYADYQ